MDEPFGALDDQTRLALQAVLLDIREERRTTILFVTHNIEEALALGDRIVVLGRGRILAEETVDIPRPRDRLSADFADAFLRLRRSFAEAVALLRDQGEGILANHLMDDVHLVRFEAGRIEMRVTEAAPPNLASRFGAVLEKACGSRWVISISQEAGETTLREQQRSEEAAKREAVMRHPLVQAVTETFPDAKLVARRDRAEVSAGHIQDDPEDADKGADDL